MADIFISYRRTDAGGHAGRLFDRLSLWFDSDALFYDLQHIDSGDNFPERLVQELEAARVVLVLIGPDWISELNRRADLPGIDFVRAEVEQAMKSQRVTGAPKIIPVLLGGAEPPSPTALHQTLRDGLVGLTSLDMHHFIGKNADWESQFVRFRELIAGIPGVPAPRYRPPSGMSKPFRLSDQSLSPHFRDPTGTLAQLRNAFASQGNSGNILPAVVCGMGGVGKTQLALKYAIDSRDSYAGVWWLRSESEQTLQVDAQVACRAAGVMIEADELPMAAFNRWLAGQSSAWLLVYDNADSPASLRKHLPQLGPHRVLITSRNSAWSGLATAVELTSWEDKDGAAFLSARLPVARHRPELQRLSHALGGLQLALEQAAAFLEDTGSSAAEYCELLESQCSAPLLLDEGRASTGYERSVLATLSLAFPRLSIAAQQLITICALLSAEPILEDYFLQGSDHLPDELRQASLQALTWNRAVGELRRFGIAQRIDWERQERHHALVFHRLTMEVARHMMAQAPVDALAAQQILRVQMNRDPTDKEQWSHYELLTAHAMQLGKSIRQDWLDVDAIEWMAQRIEACAESKSQFYKMLADQLHDSVERILRASKTIASLQKTS